MLKILEEDLESFDMSLSTIYGASRLGTQHYSSSRENLERLFKGKIFTSIYEYIKNVENFNQLDSLKKYIALSTLTQLGAVYDPEENSRINECTRFNDRMIAYDSPKNGLKMIANIALGYKFPGDIARVFDQSFDPDKVFEDIPLLIKKSEELAKKLECDMKST